PRGGGGVHWLPGRAGAARSADRRNRAGNGRAGRGQRGLAPWRSAFHHARHDVAREQHTDALHVAAGRHEAAPTRSGGRHTTAFLEQASMAWLSNYQDAAGQALADTRSVLVGGLSLRDPIASSVRLGDLSRSNSLLSLEASLKSLEQYSRLVHF